MRKPSAGRSNSLITQGPNPPRDLHVVGDYCTAFTRGDLLIRIKSKSGDVTERTDFPATIFCSDRFARIFNDREPVPFRHFKKAIHLSRNAESVNEDDGLRTVGDGSFDALGIKIESSGVHIDKNRNRTFVTDRIRDRYECERRNNNLVFIRDTERANAQMECACARADGYCIGSAEVSSDQSLELFEFRAQTELRSSKYGRHRLDVLFVDVRRRQGYSHG